MISVFSFRFITNSTYNSYDVLNVFFFILFLNRKTVSAHINGCVTHNKYTYNAQSIFDIYLMHYSHDHELV